MSHSSFAATRNHARFLLSEKATGVSSALPVTYEIIGPLDPARLDEAVNAVVQRHPMLRSEIQLEAADVSRITVSPQGDRLTHHDLTGKSEDEIDAELRDLINNHIEQAGTRFRAVLATAANERNYLNLIFHHSLIDGVSIGQFNSELSRHYNRVHAVEEQVDNSYQLAVESLLALEDDARVTKDGYWQQLLADVEKPAPIAAAVPDLTSTGLGTGCVIAQITNAEHDEMREVARTLGVRTFAVYLALGQLAMQRVTGQRDVISSFQSSGRRRFPRNERTIGLFSRALVVRTREGQSDSLRSLAQEADRQVSLGLEHEMLPFQDIIAASEAAPRFAFNWYPVQHSPEFKGCEVRERVIYPWQTTFDLNFHFVRNADGVEFRLFHNRSHCDDRCAEVLSEKYRYLLKAAINTEPDALPPALDAPTSTAIRSRPDSYGRIDEAFFDVALAHPDACAIETESSRMTYSALAQQVERVAEIFAKSRRSQPKIMVVGDRGIALVVCALGSFKARGSLALVDAAYPASRIADLIAKLEPDILAFANPTQGEEVCESSQFVSLGNGVLPDGLGAIYSQTREQSDDECWPDVAYYLFTSGSTGEPKCVAAGHAGLLHSVAWQRETFGIATGERVSFLSGVGHDPCLRDIFLPLLSSGTLCIPDPDRILEPGYVRDWLNEKRITIAHLTPAMAKILSIGRDHGFQLDHLRLAFIGGERTGPSLRKELRNIAYAARIINVYGATETPQIVLHQDITHAAQDSRADLSLGVPRDDVSLRVIDLDSRRCGYFEPGEITISTPFLSYGYINREIGSDDPFEFGSGEIYPSTYRTGDFGYHDSEHGVILIGRKDDQIKIRGYRVEPGEVTARLRAAVGHEEAEVLAVSTSDGHELVAFIAGVLTDEDIRALRSDLQSKLPVYMLPSEIVPVTSLPRLPNGKLDRQALVSLPRPRMTTLKGSDEPKTDNELKLVRIWEGVLGISSVGVNESLFDLGGDSLTGVMLMIELEKNGIDEHVSRLILSGATISEIARRMESGQSQPSKRRGPFEFGPLLSRTGVHATRGLLVLLIIAGHWFPGLSERIPQLAGLSSVVTPIFNLSTPGFAIIFGISFGYFNYKTYCSRKEIFKRQQTLGIWLLFAAMLLISVNLWVEKYISGGVLTIAFMISSFYSVIGFYLLALISLPLWFGYFRKFGFSLASLVGIIGVFVAADQLTQYLLPHDLPDGMLQLMRNYLAAKFSYFSLSIGAIAGIYIGHELRFTPKLPVTTPYLALGFACILVGVGWGHALGEIVELTSGSRRIDYWKWLIYLGASMLLVSGVWALLTSRVTSNIVLDWFIKLLASIGSLALFFFVFHGWVLGLKGLFDASGIQEATSLFLALSLFLVVSAYLIRKMWRIYF